TGASRCNNTAASRGDGSCPGNIGASRCNNTAASRGDGSCPGNIGASRCNNTPASRGDGSCPGNIGASRCHDTTARICNDGCPGNTGASQCRRHQIDCSAKAGGRCSFPGSGAAEARTTGRYRFDPCAREEVGFEESAATFSYH